MVGRSVRSAGRRARASSGRAERIGVDHGLILSDPLISSLNQLLRAPIATTELARGLRGVARPTDGWPSACTEGVRLGSSALTTLPLPRGGVRPRAHDDGRRREAVVRRRRAGAVSSLPCCRKVSPFGRSGTVGAWWEGDTERWRTSSPRTAGSVSRHRSLRARSCDALGSQPWLLTGCRRSWLFPPRSCHGSRYAR